MVKSGAKNLFRFSTLVAVIGMLLSLMVSGCGDSGDKTPAVINDEKGVVHFEFDLAAEREVSADVAYFSFYAMDSVGVVQAADLDVEKVEEYDFYCPLDTDDVAVLFLDENKAVVGLGLYDTFGKLSTTKNYDIIDPNYFTMDELDERITNFEVGAEHSHIAVGGVDNVIAVASVNVADEGAPASILKFNASAMSAWTATPTTVLKDVSNLANLYASFEGIALGTGTVKAVWSYGTHTQEGTVEIKVTDATVKSLFVESNSAIGAVADEAQAINVLLPDQAFEGYEPNVALDAVDAAQVKVYAHYENEAGTDVFNEEVTDEVGYIVDEDVTAITVEDELTAEGYKVISANAATEEAVPVTINYEVAADGEIGMYLVSETLNVNVIGADAFITIKNENLVDGALSLAKGRTAELAVVGSYQPELLGAKAQYEIPVTTAVFTSSLLDKVTVAGNKITAAAETVVDVPAIVTATYGEGETALTDAIDVTVTPAELDHYALTCEGDGTPATEADLVAYIEGGAEHTFAVKEVLSDGSIANPAEAVEGTFATDREPEVIHASTGVLANTAENGAIQVKFKPKAGTIVCNPRNVTIADVLVQYLDGETWVAASTNVAEPSELAVSPTLVMRAGWTVNGTAVLANVETEAADWAGTYGEMGDEADFTTTVDAETFVATLTEAEATPIVATDLGEVAYDGNATYFKFVAAP